MSPEAVTWATAAATVTLTVFAVVTTPYARRAYVTQSAQLNEPQQAAAGRCSSGASKASTINGGTADMVGRAGPREAGQSRTESNVMQMGERALRPRRGWRFRPRESRVA
jgi:hypothetical protein